MSLRIAKWMLALLPTFGAAQTLPDLVPHAAPGGTPLVDELLAVQPAGRTLAPGAPVLPIWSGTNGQLLAVVALPQGWAPTSPVDPAPAYGGPSAWHLVGSEIGGAGGLQWQSGNGFHAEALFGQYLASSSSACGVHCDVSDPTRWALATLAGSIGMGWSDAGGGLDLSYGLSWLQSQRATPTADALVTAGGLLPVLAIPDAGAFGLDSEASLYARGRWAFGNGPALDVSASYGRSRLSALGGAGSAPGAAAFLPGIDLDQLSLSLGLDAGSLRGAIVGHVIGSDDPLFAGKRWTTLDLGVSWRTPWSGELSVGAQNLLNTPLNARDGEGQQSRTPYIQYRQDL